MPESNNIYAFSATEIAVGEVWMEALQLDGINPEDNFFELGGDSLTTMMMMFRVSDVLDIEMPPEALMDAPTLRGFCREVDRRKSDRNAAEADYAEAGVV